MINVNQKVKFNPFRGLKMQGEDIADLIVTGTVKYVNAEHRWFSVEYGDHMRISFNFCDIGRNVNLCD